jgi:hypothetical protein
MHRRAFALIVAVFCVALVSCVGAYGIRGLLHNTQPVVAAAQPSNRVSLPSWGTGDLRDIALRMAAEAGDADPMSVRYVRKTNRQAAAILFHGDSSSNDPCYAVVLQGNFIDTKAFFPAGATPPAGTTICFVVRASDGAVTDCGINSLSYANLDQMGWVVSIAP